MTLWFGDIPTALAQVNAERSLCNDSTVFLLVLGLVHRVCGLLRVSCLFLCGVAVHVLTAARCAVCGVVSMLRRCAG